MMENGSSRVSRAAAVVLQVLVVAYFIGAILSGAYFNWTYARDHGFLKWLLLGQIVPTMKAAAWPYFVLAEHPSRRSSALPRSLKNFLFAFDALAQANHRPP